MERFGALIKMKKLYLAGVVLLISLLAVSAGEFPDDDMDGWCESPFCEKIDLCPKIACEQLGIPVENCQKTDNTDSDGDGAPNVCDGCPNDPASLVEPCTPPPRRSGGGGGGGGGVGFCEECKDYMTNSLIDQYECCSGSPQAVKSLCGMLLDSINRGIPLPKQCNLVSQTETGPVTQPLTIPLPYTGQIEQPTLAERQAPVAVDNRRVEAPRAPIPDARVQLEAESDDLSWVPIVVILALILVGLVYYWRKQKVY